MIDQDQDQAKVVQLAGHSSRAENLSYRIELRQAGKPEAVERLLGLAMSTSLAQAMFKAARDEYPGRHIVVLRGKRVILDSASG